MTEPDTASTSAASLAAGERLFERPWRFLKSVPALEFLPPADRVEVALAGRSNVGKSSLINALLRQNGLARTSNTPGRTQELHHEIELVVAIGGSGVNVDARDAQALVFGYAVGLDMTRRDLQNDMREKKRPWDIGKSFAHAAPIAPIHPVTATGALTRGEIALDVNGQARQRGDLADMIWKIPEMIAFLSRMYRLEPGDLIFTGTPAGVAAVVAGDRLDGRIAGLTPLSIEIAAPDA